MGPMVLLDKSFLKALNLREASILQRHYSPVLCNILMEELISDLSNPKLSGEGQLKEVTRLVAKAKGMNLFTLPDARVLVEASLNGANLPLEPRIPRFGGRESTGHKGATGLVFDPTPEEMLLGNWADGKFSQEDYEIAGQLKRDFIEYDLPASQKEMQRLYPDNAKIDSLESVAVVVDTKMVDFDEWSKVALIANFAGIPADRLKKIKARWEAGGFSRFELFSPYAHYCYRVFSIYFLGITATLISTSKSEKTLIDILYFLYLPFCMVFCSSDNFHRDLFPLFARKNQNFLLGDELKKDLGVIASCHEKMTEKEKLDFERDFGSYPPPILNSCTVEIWRKHMAPWKPGSGNRAAGRTPEENAKVLEELEKITGLKFTNKSK